MKRRLTTLHRFGYGFFLLVIPIFLFSTASVILAQTGTGTIKGVVDSPWVHRYPALVYIDHVKGTFPPPAKEYHISQKNLVFAPHINPILNGTTVDFTNDDTVVHNVFTPPGSASRFNLGNYGHGVAKSYKFDKLGVSTLLCAVHPEMVAFVIVLQNPYYTISDNSGNFKIENVPAGTYQLKFWNEKLKAPAQTVTVKAGNTAEVTFKDLKKKE